MVTQVCFPWIVGKPAFWLFRSGPVERKHKEVLQRKKDAEERLRIAELEAETSRLEIKASLATSNALDEEIALLEQNESSKRMN